MTFSLSLHTRSRSWSNWLGASAWRVLGAPCGLGPRPEIWHHLPGSGPTRPGWGAASTGHRTGDRLLGWATVVAEGRCHLRGFVGVPSKPGQNPDIGLLGRASFEWGGPTGTGLRLPLTSVTFVPGISGLSADEDIPRGLSRGVWAPTWISCAGLGVGEGRMWAWTPGSWRHSRSP